MKYSNKILEEICDYIGKGISNKGAANLAGVCESTFYKWLSDDKNNPLTKSQKTEFLESMGMARARRGCKLTSTIMRASETDWRAAAWYLARTCPEEYGDKVKAVDFTKPGKKIDIPKDMVDKFNKAFEMIVTGRKPADHRLYFNDGVPIKEHCSLH